MAALTSDDLRQYVLGAERKVGKGYILLNFTHNLTARTFAEISFSIDNTVEDVKDKIYGMTGSKPEYMELYFHGQPMEDDRTLQSYGADNHDVINVLDNDPHSLAKNGGLDNTKLVKKFELTDEEYDKRPNTYRAWKKEQLAKNPNWTPSWNKLNQNMPKAAKKTAKEGEEEKKNEDQGDPDDFLESLDSVQARIKVGNRCEIYPGGRRGEVMFVGFVPAITHHSINQVWIGVKYDEPVGKNDGTLKGHKYFTAKMKYGAFVKSENIKVGDYPELDDFDFDSDKEEETEEKSEHTHSGSCCDDHKATTPKKEGTTENIMEEL